MEHSLRYGERDYTFGQLMLTLRTTIGLTQGELADRLGVSRRTIAGWETGSTYPKAEHLKAFLALCVRASAFPAGREEEQMRALWKAAHLKVLLDEDWLRELLRRQTAPLAGAAPRTGGQTGDAAQARPDAGSRVDWGEAFDVPVFYNRQEETATLERWVVGERCRVVSVLGLGGIGKSALVISLMRQVAPHFEVVLWRSLRDAPPYEALLEDCLQVLAPQPLADMPPSLEERQRMLLDYLRAKRALLVLDNLESLLEEGERAGPGPGRVRAGYEGYARLLRQVAQTEHQSCLLFTSREKPGELVHLEGGRAPVRSLRLSGLEREACEHLIDERDLVGSAGERARLIERYGGNPLAIKIVAQSIADLFGGEIAPFLAQNTIAFGSIAELLAEQFDRLSEIERTMLLWLAILREPVTLEELLAVLAAPPARMQVLEALEALRRRSLLERGKQPRSFTLQSVVLEYATERFIAEVADDIEQGHLAHLVEHGLELATAKEYVRQTQQRLIVAPLLARLRGRYRGRDEVEERLLALLDELRARADHAQGYGPTNVLALLREQRGHLRDLDLSRLAIRGASLQGVQMQDTTLTGATLRDITFTEAFDDTWSLAISRDGHYWAVSGKRGEVRVWQAGRRLHLVWQAHTSTIMALAFRPDGRTLATGSRDGSLKLWDLEHGDLLWTAWLPDSVNYIAFAPDGGVVASCGNDAVIRLWDVPSGTPLQTLIGHTGPLFALAWNPDGRLLASGGVDGVIRLWDLSAEQSEPSVRVLSGHTGWISGLAFSPDGHDAQTLASASWDRTVKLWDVGEEGSVGVRQTLTGHIDYVFRLAWSPDGHLLASCGRERAIWLWDVERSSYRMALHGHSAAVHDLAFTPDNRYLLSDSEDGTVRTWDVESGQCVHIMQGYAISLYDLNWNPNSTRLASVGSDTMVIIWDGAGKKRPMLLAGHRTIPYGVAWSPDGRRLASAGEDNAIRVWDASTGTTVQVLRDFDHAEALFHSVAWSPDGTFLAGGSALQGVQVWEVATGECRWVGRTDASARLRRIAWSPDGTLLAGCCEKGSVLLWKASDGTLVRRLQGHQSVVECVVWSLDGERLAGGSGYRGSGEIFIWNALSGERLYILKEPGEVVQALAWSSTGEVLVSGGADGMLRWWDLRHGECVKVRKAHQGAVQSLKLSPDGQRLASCGDDGAITIWDIESGERLETLRRDRPYERLDITGVQGLTEAQRGSLLALGAIEGHKLAL